MYAYIYVYIAAQTGPSIYVGGAEAAFLHVHTVHTIHTYVGARRLHIITKKNKQ